MNQQVFARGARPGSPATLVIGSLGKFIDRFYPGKVVMALSAQDDTTVEVKAAWFGAAEREDVAGAALTALKRIADDERVVLELRQEGAASEADQRRTPEGDKAWLLGLTFVPLDAVPIAGRLPALGFSATVREASGVFRRLPDEENAPAGISRGVAERLMQELRAWTDAGTVDAFRYEMFAKRIGAAECGRVDAVEWARSWYQDILNAEAEAHAQAMLNATLHTQRRQYARAELLAGRVGNPHYQAFLDTVEDPATLTSHAPYMDWINKVTGEFDRHHPLHKFANIEARQELWVTFLQGARNRELSDRVRKQEAKKG